MYIEQMKEKAEAIKSALDGISDATINLFDGDLLEIELDNVTFYYDENGQLAKTDVRL